MSDIATDQVLRVRISKATQTVWEGEAYSVSAQNVEGPFDILPLHAHFISVLDAHPIVVTHPDKSTSQFTFTKSIMHVKDNLVSIYAEIS